MPITTIAVTSQKPGSVRSGMTDSVTVVATSERRPVCGAPPATVARDVALGAPPAAGVAGSGLRVHLAADPHRLRAVARTGCPPCERCPVCARVEGAAARQRSARPACRDWRRPDPSPSAGGIRRRFRGSAGTTIELDRALLWDFLTHRRARGRRGPTSRGNRRPLPAIRPFRVGWLRTLAAEAWGAVCPRAFRSSHVHVKDGEGAKREFQNAPGGDGDLHMERVLELIRAAGYQAPLCPKDAIAADLETVLSFAGRFPIVTAAQTSIAREADMTRYT